MIETALICKIARLQVQQMMRVHDVAAILVYRRMAHRVAHHADTARKSKSICEKCCEVSCSESCAEANINCLRCCERTAREACAASNSPLGFAYLSDTRFDTASYNVSCGLNPKDSATSISSVLMTRHWKARARGLFSS